MSAHGDATPGDAAASHDHQYEGIPADRPGADEPRTPLWLPLVGLVLVLFGLFAFLLMRPAGKTAAELTNEANPEASAAAAVPPASAQPTSMRPTRVPRMPGMASAFAMPPGAAPRPVPSGAVRLGMGMDPGAGRPLPAPAPAPTNPPHGQPGHVH
jgi:hypothetical protein